MRTRLLVALAGTSMAAIVASAPARAQETPAPQASAAPTTSADDAPEDEDTIIITGTQIRGTTPAGSTLLTTTAEQAEEQGATNGNEILSQLPQASNFFQSLPSLAGLQGSTTAGLVAVSRIPSQGVSLRNLPNVNVGGSPTLILIDGHRVVPSGTNVLGGQNVDNSTIAASTLLRTEIMPDGGSAIYGSDAVTGVINYITRDEFQGVEVQARAGFAGDYYWQYDGSVTAGTKWNTGSIYGAFAYSNHDALLGKDIDYLATVDRNPFSPLFNMPNGLNCGTPNISITSVANGANSRRLYPLTDVNGTIQPFTTNGGTNGSGSTATTNGVAGGNRCNSTDFTSFYPEERRYNASFGLVQELSETLVFRLKAGWTRRESETSQGINFSPMITSTNPNYRPVCNAPGPGATGNICGTTPGFFVGDHNRTQQILTNLQPVGIDSVPSFVTLKSWQVTPSLTWDFARDWQLRALVSYGKSDALGIQGAFDSTTAQNRVNSGLINPYNLPGGSAGAFDNLFTFSAQNGKFTLFDARVIADGPLFTMPAGEARVAVGGEYFSTKLAQRATGTVLSNTPSNFTYVNPIDGSSDPLRYKQTVKAVFAEVQLPLFSEEMNVPLINSLRLSASARYDKYSDVGSTFNPMIGATWEPVNWITVRGNWNTSFAAPTNMTMLGTVTGAQAGNGGGNCNGPAGALCLNGGTPSAVTGGVIPYFRTHYAPGNINGGTLLPAGQTNASAPLGARNETTPTGLVLSFTNGTDPNIKPQKSEAWSIGIDFEPPFLPGLTFGVSYYDLQIEGTIASPFNPAVQSAFDEHPEVIYCHGGVIGTAANAAAACAVPMSLAELDAAGFLVPVTAGGLALPSSLTTAGPQGSASGSNLPWSVVRANYCSPEVYTSGAGGGANCPPNSYSVFYVADNRQRNLGNLFSRGIDFHANYRTNVPWGTLDARVTGTLSLETSTQIANGLPRVDIQKFDTSKWRLSANLGTTSGGFRGQVTWQHSDGFDINPSNVGTPGTATIPGTGAFGQVLVKAYDTFDLFLRYDFDSWANKNGIFKDLSVMLNVNNIFDNAPPRRGSSFSNGITLGRMFQLGIVKRFGGE